MRTTSASLPGEGKYIEILFSFQCEKKQFIFVSWVGGWGNIVYRKSKERAIERLSTYLGGQRIFCALKSFIEWLLSLFLTSTLCELTTVFFRLFVNIFTLVRLYTFYLYWYVSFVILDATLWLDELADNRRSLLDEAVNIFTLSFTKLVSCWKNIFEYHKTAFKRNLVYDIIVYQST